MDRKTPLLRGVMQRHIVTVGIRTFGVDNMTNREERLLRFLEEALELVRAGGLDIDHVKSVVDYEFSRPQGDATQEFGGAACTLFAAADAHGLDLLDCAGAEIRRVENLPVGSAKKKHDGKPDSVKARA